MIISKKTKHEALAFRPRLAAVLVLVKFAGLSASLFAQDLRVERLVIQNGFASIIGDPEDPSDLIRILRRDDVKKHIHLSENAIAALGRVDEESAKIFRELAKARKKGEINQKGMTEAWMARRAEVSDIMNELLTPDELRKLKQVAFRFEVWKVGLSNALVTGRLGATIGVYNQQKPKISRRAEEIYADLERKIARLKVEAEERLLSDQLTPEQRDLARELLGPPVDFKEPTPLLDKVNELAAIALEEAGLEKD